MFKRIVLTLLLCNIWLYADTPRGTIEITAIDINATSVSISATGNVLVYYAGSVIKSDRALYNKTGKILTLDGAIDIIGYNGSKEHTSHMTIYTDNDRVVFDKLFLVSPNDLWLFSKSASKQDNHYTLGETVLSSCEISHPLWTMRFSHALYDATNYYIKLYNTTVYLWKFPVFYSPYFAFSTARKRATGLLFPFVGYSALEGFLYEQPFYWAISDSMDLELNPQIRTNRSVGVYSTFRFANTPYSSGEIRLGYFKDKSTYVLQNSLPNNSHFGLEFNYQSSQVFKRYLGESFREGLYINSTFLNDIDYLNLQHSGLTHFGLIPLQESRINYYLQNNEYYAGVNAKYFIDTRQNVNHDQTLQILPSSQYHKYLKSFIWSNLTYSADVKLNHFYRKTGTTLKQVEFTLPMEFSASFLNNFLNVSLGETLYYSKFFFDNGTFLYKNFRYRSNIHTVKIFTDLTKKYKDYIHVLQPSLSYVKPGSESQSPVRFSQLDATQQALFTVGLPEEQYRFSLSQYVYDSSMQLKFYQRFTQNYYRNRVSHLADMNNEMEYHWKEWRMYNNIIYSYQYSKLRESSTQLRWIKDTYQASLGHTYTAVLPDTPTAIATNTIDFGFTYTYNQHIDFSANFSYDMKKTSNTQWKIGGSYHVDCWSISASLREEVVPRPNGYSANTNFYVQLNFVPFARVGTGD